MKENASILNPAVFSQRVLRRKSRDSNADSGFSLIEIMAGMAIIAILALAILPQFSKFFERAAVQNLSSEVSNAALLVESDYSLTGKTTYDLTNVRASVAESKSAKESTLKGQLLNTAGAITTGTAHGFTVQGINPGVTNYVVIYNSTGLNPGLTISKGTPPTSLVP